MIPDFLQRSSLILEGEPYKKISSANISLAGLGGVGGLTFLSLVRSGVENFKIAERGIFDMPDLNRQALAYRSNIDKAKIDLYENAAKDINPNVNLEVYKEGITVENIEEFMKGSNIFIRVIDYQTSKEVKDMIPSLIDKLQIPLFQSMTIWNSSIIHNYEPSGCKPEEFFSILDKKWNKIKPYIFSRKDSKTKPQIIQSRPNAFPTMCIGANLAALFLASEVLVFLLQGTHLIDRDVIYTPNFVIVDAFKMEMNVLNILKL